MPRSRTWAGLRATAAFGLTALLASAETGIGARAETAQTTDQEAAAERLAFVSDNVVFTFYHELGHALIDLLDVPVMGREEDAVDALAVLLSSWRRAPEVADAMIVSAAESFAISDEWAAMEGEAFVFWDEHSLDPQRFYSILCLYYGGEPDALEDLANDVGLPEDRRDLCIEERLQTERAWSGVLDQLEKSKNSRFEKGLSLIKDAPETADNRAAAELLGQDNALEQAIADFNASFATPSALTVTLTGCGEANAFYDPESRNIILCYELVGEFREQIDWALEEDS